MGFSEGMKTFPIILPICNKTGKMRYISNGIGDIYRRCWNMKGLMIPEGYKWVDFSDKTYRIAAESIANDDIPLLAIATSYLNDPGPQRSLLL